MKKGLFIGLILFIISFFFDKKIALFFSNVPFKGINLNFSSTIVTLLIITTIFLWRKKDFIYYWISLIITSIITVLFKLIIKRPRPFTELNLTPYTFDFWNTSFPSWHAAIAFCLVPFLSRKYPKYRYLWFLLASIVGFSRIYVNVHYLSDVIGGALLGYYISKLIISKENWLKFKLKINEKFFR